MHQAALEAEVDPDRLSFTGSTPPSVDSGLAISRSGESAT
jgi:hypothetical protein